MRYILLCFIGAAAPAFAAWQTPVNLGTTLNTGRNEWYPFLARGGSFMVFVSDRAGGQGAADLWRTDSAGGAWQTPVNLGRVVNSPTDEYPRWVSDDGDTLVFCSRREGGSGGSDIWYTKRVGGSWQVPVNFGPVVNSSAHEWGATFKCNHGRVGGIMYFGSGRPGGQSNWDLWRSTDSEYHAVAPASFGRVKALFR